MPPVYVKPENALRRAEELLALGTTQSQAQAFEFLSEVFLSKRFKHAPIPTLEPIIIKYLDLCVSLHRKSDAREALVQYKNAAQNVNVGSIEKVLRHFLDQSESKLKAAMEQAATEVAALPASSAEPEDDELPLQPLTMLQDAFIDSAGDRERIERRLIGPAQKFCWDSYDVALDIAKGNDRLEIIYQEIAHRAFKFCKEHSRKSDFRRLCEQRLRKDLANATKYGHQQHAVNLADPETLSRHLDTRFLQLETAVELELWQEAFRSVEDVHGLVAGKKGAKPSMMANYYEKLTQIFGAEGGKQTAVFHAAAWARYYQYAERAGTVSDRAPAAVLLSALAVPLGDVETKQRLVALLNLPKMPTREALVKDAGAKHLKRVPADVRQLYNIVEVDFQPLKACKLLAPIVAKLPADFAAYLPALRDVILSRLIQELSRVYETISLQYILSLVKAFDGGPWETDMPALEKFLMTASRRGDLNATVDHVAKTVNFAAPPADLNRLSNLAIYLHNAIQYLNPTPVVSRADAFAAALAEAEEERKQIAHRRLIVQKRRELLEEANLRREREESTARAERAKQLAEETARAQKEAARQAELDRLQKMMDETRREEARKLAEQLANKNGLKVDVDAIKDEDLDTTKIVAMQVEHIAKEKRELNERLRIIAKRVDHLERAYRKEERPLLVTDYERQKEEDRKAHDRINAQAREAAIAQQKYAIELKARLGRMMPDYAVARSAVESQQQAEFEAARQAAAQKIAEEKSRFLAGVLARHRAEKEAREQREREAEEAERAAREREEEEARLTAERAEAEARAAAEIEQRKKEAADRAAAQKAEREAERARDAEKIRQQREREEEAERRRAERAGSGAGFRRPETAAPTPSPASAGGYRPPAVAAGGAAAAGGGGGWRERLAAKKAAEAGGAAPVSPATPPPTQSPANGSPAEPSPERGGVYRRGMGVPRGGGPGGGARTPSGRGGARW
ncbi:eukaryotic translation initiation factor 3 subunit A [Vanrija albida]|uniref:Eukaryotic translation initiation factor 3 subunit A n=1 Tax=Vanrija albida TaxID=181172 RepID=A0ABR3PY73_9TREE